MSWYKKSQIDIQTISVNLAGVLYKMLKEIQQQFEYFSISYKSNEIERIRIFSEKSREKIKEELLKYNKIHNFKWNDTVVEKLTINLFHVNGNSFQDIIDVINDTLKFYWIKMDELA